MLLTVIKSAASACIVVGIAAGCYCGRHNIRSLDDLRNFRAMRSDPSPITMALADGSLRAGSTTAEMLMIDRPVGTSDYGRCVIYSFTHGQSYERRTVVTVDGRVTAAHVGSCTWAWTFFDETPDDVDDAVRSVSSLRSVIKQMPQYKKYLQPALNAELIKLGMKPGQATPNPALTP